MQLLRNESRITGCNRAKNVALQIVMVVFLSSVFGAGYALAIGKWEKGYVTNPPWQDTFTYITINNGRDTRYVVMKDAKLVSVYEKNGVQSQDQLSLSSIHKGDTLVFMAEGNRIYHIKKIYK